MDDDVPAELAALDDSNGARRFDWHGMDGDELLGLFEALLDAGYAVRLSLVGYGFAVRLAATDGRGYTAGWTLGSGEELRTLARGLLMPGGLEYIKRRLEKPLRRR